MKVLQSASFCHAMSQIAKRLQISHLFSLKIHEKLRIFGPNIGNIEYKKNRKISLKIEKSCKNEK